MNLLRNSWRCSSCNWDNILSWSWSSWISLSSCVFSACKDACSVCRICSCLTSSPLIWLSSGSFQEMGLISHLCQCRDTLPCPASMQCFRWALCSCAGWWSSPAIRVPSASQGSGQWIVFMLLLIRDVSWLPLSSSTHCKWSCTAFHHLRTHVLLFHPSIFWQRHPRHCWRWVFSFIPTMSYSWRRCTLPGMYSGSFGPWSLGNHRILRWIQGTRSLLGGEPTSALVSQCDRALSSVFFQGSLPFWVMTCLGFDYVQQSTSFAIWEHWPPLWVTGRLQGLVPSVHSSPWHFCRIQAGQNPSWQPLFLLLKAPCSGWHRMAE